MTLLSPISIDWLTPEGWQMNPAFEPPAATNKRITYALEKGKSYRICKMNKLPNGSLVRMTSDPLPAETFAVFPEGQNVVEIQENLPTIYREYEFWFYKD